MSSSRTNRTGSIIAFVVAGITVIATVILIMYRQQVIDQITVWNYTPSTQIAAIEERVQFSEEGTFTFHAVKPEVLGRDSFNSACPRQEPGSPILGCYTSDDRVYIYDVQNVQLDGMKEVTAAHEMLHAVWHRLSSAERDALTKELTAVYEAEASDELRERMEYYERTQPGEFGNELHSILATEAATLNPTLEHHFAKYFKDRQVVVGLHDKYNAVYQSLQEEIDTLYEQLETLADSIEQQSVAYEEALLAYSADVDSFNARVNAGTPTSDAEFNSLNRRYNALESQRLAINADIATHETMYARYEVVAGQIEVLNKSIDSIKTIEEVPAL